MNAMRVARALVEKHGKVAATKKAKARSRNCLDPSSHRVHGTRATRWLFWGAVIRSIPRVTTPVAALTSAKVPHAPQA